MQFYSITDRGRQRENNEDYCIAKNIGKYALLILADGMGGHQSGEIASQKAVETVYDFLRGKLDKKLIPGQIMLFLSDALEKANEEIFELSKKNKELLGMGTTLEVCIVYENTAYVAHIGDSRVYKFSRNGEIYRLTKDHSLVEYMIETGSITPEEAATHPQKNVITRALGITPETEADIFSEKLEKGERLLLCSDGLTNMSEQTIRDVVLSSKEPKDGADKLLQLANDAGGADNITIIIATHNNMEENE